VQPNSRYEGYLDSHTTPNEADSKGPPTNLEFLAQILQTAGKKLLLQRLDCELRSYRFPIGLHPY
jgi:hypothetical protein